MPQPAARPVLSTAVAAAVNVSTSALLLMVPPFFRLRADANTGTAGCQGRQTSLIAPRGHTRRQISIGGRPVVLGDSSPADDGRCTSCSASLHDGWDEASARPFILNATAWLAHDGS